VRKITDLFAILCDSQWTYCYIEPPTCQAGKIPGKIGFTKFELDTECRGDPAPELDADPAPAAVGLMDIKWRTGSDADDKLFCLGKAGAGIEGGRFSSTGSVPVAWAAGAHNSAAHQTPTKINFMLPGDRRYSSGNSTFSSLLGVSWFPMIRRAHVFQCNKASSFLGGRIS
jgi:hypothetical protein